MRMQAANEEAEDKKLFEYEEHTKVRGQGHSLVKVAQTAERKKQWLCDKSNKGKGLCYSGNITLEESIEYSRYQCIFNDPMCTFRLCESCGMIYAKGKDIIDILHVKRPPNKKLWSIFFESDTKTQKVLPFEKFRQDYSWSALKGFSSKDIKA